AYFLGLAVASATAVTVLVAGGAGVSADDDIVLFGRALATDTLADPSAPSAYIRWLNGNADPRGRLPPPVGDTDYLVWWGTGSWPRWLASAPATLYLLFSRRSSAPRRVVAASTVSACLQVVIPGLYWQHYYLLPIAGVAFTVALCLTDALNLVVRRVR